MNSNFTDRVRKVLSMLLVDGVTLASWLMKSPLTVVSALR